MATTTVAKEINPINSQGTKIFVVAKPATAWADCTASATAILAGKQVLCPQSLGAIEQTRSVTEYKCLSSNDSKKILGAISRGSIDIGMLFDPTDTAGQKDLASAFENNTPVIIGIELPDADTKVGTKGAQGTIKWFEGGISSESIPIEMDTAILYNVTVEISSKVTTCPMIAGTKNP